MPFVNGTVEAFEELDDGSGQGRALFIAGDFEGAGTEPARHLVRWHGDRWSSLSAMPNAKVWDLQRFDFGAGEELVACGQFTSIGGAPFAHVARWNGASWSALGTGFPSTVFALTSFDDGLGAGPRLHAGAPIASGPVSSVVARWTGAQWVPVGTTLGGNVAELATHVELGVRKLYAAGLLSVAGVPTRLAEWDGATWQPTVINEPVMAMFDFDDGSGSALYVSTSGAPQRIQRLQNGAWTTIGAFPWFASSFAVHDDGSGPALFAGFFGASPGSLVALRKWTGTAWIDGLSFPRGGGVQALCSFVEHAGAQPTLYLGGGFDGLGGDGMRSVARFDGVDARALGHGDGLTASVYASAVFDDGNGPRLFAGGLTLMAEHAEQRYVLDFDGRSWRAPGTTAVSVFEAIAATVYDDGSGPGVWFAGSVNTSALIRWDGTAWSHAAGQVLNSVSALGTYDDGAGLGLYAAGNFQIGAQFFDIACWDGTSWSPLGNGAGGVESMGVFDDGTGPQLYVGGSFSSVDGGSVPAFSVARWNGTNWSSPGTAIPSGGEVRALVPFDDGSGPALYAAGFFHTLGGIAAESIARWNGASWSPVGAGFDSRVNALEVFDDGSGPALYAAGVFTHSGATIVRGLARWDGGQWNEVGGGLRAIGSGTAEGQDLCVYDDGLGGGPALFVFGHFVALGDVPCTNVARWSCSTSSSGNVGEFCFGDGLDASHTSACPCGNTGAVGRGCASSVNAAGAVLGTKGDALLDTLVLSGSGMPASSTCIYLQGDARDDQLFGDGVRCAGGVLLRLRATQNSAGASRFPSPADTLTLSQRGGVIPGSGATRFYQTYYRNAAASFCPPATFNVTNGIVVTW